MLNLENAAGGAESSPCGARVQESRKSGEGGGDAFAALAVPTDIRVSGIEEDGFVLVCI